MDDRRARRLLLKRRNDLEDVVRQATQQGSLDESQTDSTGESSALDQHPGDLASDTLEREIDLSVRDSAEAGLQDVGRALERVERGTYGVCPVCREAISDERLEARPEAEFCIDHQPTAAPAPPAPLGADEAATIERSAD